jgi:hypothetical protein
MRLHLISFKSYAELAPLNKIEDLSKIGMANVGKIVIFAHKFCLGQNYDIT